MTRLARSIAAWLASGLRVRAQRPREVHVLWYSHRSGDDISVHATRELAYSAVAEIARYFWAEAAEAASCGMPDSPDGLSDSEAIRLYFEVMDDECATIIPAVVQRRQGR